MSFDLTDLRLFLLIVEAGSITHGAERPAGEAPAGGPSWPCRDGGQRDIMAAASIRGSG